jgi:hypothetical protein
MRFAINNKFTNGKIVRTSNDSLRTIGSSACTDIFSAHLYGISACTDRLPYVCTKVSHIHAEPSHIYTEFPCVRIFSPHICAEFTHVRTGSHPYIRNLRTYGQNSRFYKILRFFAKKQYLFIYKLNKGDY